VVAKGEDAASVAGALLATGSLVEPLEQPAKIKPTPRAVTAVNEKTFFDVRIGVP
jgi:hypothetical protein